MELNQDKPSIETLVALETSIKSLEELSRAPYNESDLNQVEKCINIAVDVAKYLLTIDYDIYPDLQRAEINQAARNLTSRLHDLMAPSVLTGDQAYSIFRGAYNDFVSSVNRVIPINTAYNPLMNRLEETYDSIIGIVTETKESLSESQRVLETLSDLEKESKILVEGAKASAQEVIVTRYGIVYDELSKKHNFNANWWLGGTLIIVILLCLFSYFTFQQSLQFIKDNQALLKYSATMVIWIGSRLVIYSTLFVALSVSISNYKANRHNQILNKHRQNALNTFETFVKSSSDDKAIKDAILLEVTRTIFGVQNTGFSASDSEGEAQSKVVEIVKSFTSDK